MNYKTLSAKKRKFIELKEINNFEVNKIINEVLGKHKIDFIIKDKVYVY